MTILSTTNFKQLNAAQALSTRVTHSSINAKPDVMRLSDLLVSQTGSIITLEWDFKVHAPLSPFVVSIPRERLEELELKDTHDVIECIVYANLVSTEEYGLEIDANEDLVDGSLELDLTDTSAHKRKRKRIITGLSGHEELYLLYETNEKARDIINHAILDSIPESKKETDNDIVVTRVKVDMLLTNE